MWPVRACGLAWLAFLASLAYCPGAIAQSVYELSAPELNRTSHATLTGRELRILDQTGRETLYQREPRFDSSDRAFLAYHNRAAGQIIRWPALNHGPMQIGTSHGLSVEYRTSQMRVIARDATAAPLGGVGIGGGGALLNPAGSDLFAEVWQQRQTQPQLTRLVTSDDRGQRWSLGRAGRDRLTLVAMGNTAHSDWYVVPAGSGYVRVQQVMEGQWLALTAAAGRRLALESVAQDAGQLWRVVRSNAVSDGYWLESAVTAGVALTGTPAGVVSLLPIGSSPGQVWLPIAPVAAPNFEPLWRTVSHEVRANPPLPAAQIDLLNSHSNPLAIIIADRRASGTRQVRIEPGMQVTVPFERDAGGTVVETYEIRGPSGVWDRQQLVTPIPPSPIYDLSVYEEFLQSIAIDRTGTSPNPIEDINYQPKSVGWLPLPAGTALPDRGQLDPFALAKAANNPGAVRRFDPTSLSTNPSTALDPLEAKLREVAPSRPTPSRPTPPPPAPPAQRQKF